MTENNKKQALVFEGATVLPNRNGMAPGMAVEKDGIHYIFYQALRMKWSRCLPMKQFLTCLCATGKKEVITSRVLKFYGIGEAELEFRLQSILERQTNPTVAPLATAEAVTLRLTAKAARR